MGWVFLPPTSTGESEEWIAPQRAAAIARIVRAVGKHVDNEIRLAGDIHQAYCESETPSMLVLFEGPQAQRRLKLLQRILKGVEKQAGLIESDPYVKHEINKVSSPFEIPTVQHLLLKLRNLEESLKWLAEQWRSKADVPENPWNRRPSQLEWLAGVLLPLVYERHFLRRAGRSRDMESGEPSGPMIRFIEATLKELGEQIFKRESIARAFTRYTSQRNAERSKRKGQTSIGREF
jgi:hypothetical protein